MTLGTHRPTHFPHIVFRCLCPVCAGQPRSAVSSLRPIFVLSRHSGLCGASCRHRGHTILPTSISAYRKHGPPRGRTGVGRTSEANGRRADHDTPRFCSLRVTRQEQDGVGIGSSLLIRRYRDWFDPKQDPLRRTAGSRDLPRTVWETEPTSKQNQRLVRSQLRAL